jgi:hypothetical protein
MGFDWLHRYNHHRFHAASKGEPPISRVNNLAERLQLAQEIPRAAMSPAASGGRTVEPSPRRTSDAQRDLFDGCLT